MFVPVSRITIIKNDDSVTFDPPYCLPLYKLKWRDKCKKITIERITEKHLNPMAEIVCLPGLSAVETEEKRLIKRFGVKTFYTVYPGETFKETFEKVATERNLWKEKHDAEKAEAMKKARQEARTVVVSGSV